MTTITDNIETPTSGRQDMINITPSIDELVKKHNVQKGIAVVFVIGSTAALTTIEFEPGLKQDMKLFLEKILPYNGRYHHHDIWHDDNGSSHLQASLLGPSISIPIVDGSLTLGTWQQVVLIDCDTRKRSRRLAVQLIY